MRLLDIKSILSDCDILEDISALECKSFKAQYYEYLFKARLIINKEKKIPIVICIPEKWYRDLIDIYIENYDELEFLPHIDNKGKLCLFELEGILIDQNLHGILLQSLFRAKNILADGFSKNNTEDFIKEFELYWCQLLGIREVNFVVPVEESCQIVKGILKKPSQRKNEKQFEYFKRVHFSSIYVGKSTDDLKRWKLGKMSIINVAYFVIAPAVEILPPDIRKPVSLTFLNELLKYVSSKDISNILPRLSKNKVIIFKIKQPNGILNFVGFIVEDGKLEKNEDKYFLSSAGRLQPLAVRRSDKKYLMMRTAQTDTNAKKKMLIVGCGSIGGYLIHELAKNGFEDITIVDDDYLSEENIFRHILGMEYVSKYKCVAMEEYIRKNIPEVSIKSLVAKFEDAILDEDINLKDYDMIISATGNHNLNRWLNSYIFDHKIGVPIIYAWNEVYGIGNHVAYFRYGNIGCYECLFGRDETTGELYDKSSYCERGQKIVQDVGGCGKTYVPYGDMISLKTVLMCTEVIRDVFSGNLVKNLLVSVKGDDGFFIEQGLKPSGRYLRQKESVKKLTGGQILNIECGVCGGN